MPAQVFRSATASTVTYGAERKLTEGNPLQAE